MEPFTAKCKQSVSIRSVQSQYVNIECVIKPHMSWVYSNVNETQKQGSLTFITSGAHKASIGLRSYLRSRSLWRQCFQLYSVDFVLSLCTLSTSISFSLCNIITSTITVYGILSLFRHCINGASNAASVTDASIRQANDASCSIILK